MALFISRIGNSSAALSDVFSITRCDANLGQDPFSTDADKITYTRSAAGAGQDRIEALTQQASAILIFALPAGSQISDGAGGTVPIALVGGATFPPDANGVIQVAYCFDNRMFAFAADGSQVSLPRQVILFHELSHAFHRANGSFNAADPEFQAITDENSFRAQVGIAARDPANHNGGQGAGNGQQVPTCTGIAPNQPGPSCCNC